MTNVVIYIRYATDNQRGASIEDACIEAQIRTLRGFSEKNNLNIVKTYIDRAKTGTNGNRTDFQKIIEYSNLKTCEQVIVHKLDRFSRDKYDSTINNRKFKKNGVVGRKRFRESRWFTRIN